jgi:hypothetical protein
MKRLATALGLLPVLPLLWPGTGTPAAGETGDGACIACHPGPSKGLRQSPHAALLRDEATRERACTVCHGDLSAHFKAALEQRRVPVPAVTATACRECHKDQSWPPSFGAHPLPRRPLPEAPPAATGEPSEPPGLRLLGLDWNGFLEAGWRFARQSGSEARYRTDINLDDGPVLHSAELSGRGESGFVQRAKFRADDLGDPYQSARGELGKPESWQAAAEWEKSIYHYEASGDYHRVDQKRQQTLFDFDTTLAAELSLFGSFVRSSQDGYWLTHRIGVRNVTPQTTIAGVESPRQWDSDRAEAGLRGGDAELSWTAAFGYEGHDQRDSWYYSQPASRNPAFTESEDFTSHTALRGPDARLSLHWRTGPLTLDLGGRWLERERNLVGEGVTTGYDISDFVTTTNAEGSGRAETWLADGTAEYEIGDAAALVADLRWLSHRETYDTLQTDFTRYPTLGSSTTVTTDLFQRTVQRVFEGSLQVDYAPARSVDLSLGYGFSREWLEVPDLQSGDQDFLSGLTQTDGLLAAFAWKPDAHWKLRGGYRGYGSSGLYLHEISEDEVHESNLALGHRRDSWSSELFVKDRRYSNDISRTRNETTTAGLNLGLHPHEDLTLHASYVIAWIDGRTLTNFYFDPDPTPVPTYVGFEGETHTVVAGLSFKPCARLTWRLDGLYTATDGSFDVDLYDWQTDLAARLIERGEAGINVRSVDYEEASGLDDYQAVLITVYWRQRF